MRDGPPQKVTMVNPKAVAFKKVLIANRGAIATRIIRTLKKMHVTSVAVYHSADENSLHVQHADEAICLGDGTVGETYLNIDKIIAIAKAQSIDAIHPGYGFLSENTDFVARCEAEEITFIGPTAEQIKTFGLKHTARELAKANQAPMIPGTPLLQDIDDARSWARDIGYPVMLKSTAGGGGIGMQMCPDEDALINAWQSVKRLSANFFSNDGVFLEKYIVNARHIEVQVFGDGQGNVIHLGERDCSAQRRNQKVIEETPAPHINDPTRRSLYTAAIQLTKAVNYRNAGTVEFIFDNDSRQFYFLEVNTRLQVEHGVTEAVWKVDLVEWMLRLADQSLPPLEELQASLSPQGHAMQARVYAENPNNNFLPSAGLLSYVHYKDDEHTRIDTWVESGIDVPALFDPMIAKIICWGNDREAANARLTEQLEKTTLYGIETNLEYLSAISHSETCTQGQLVTRSLHDFIYTSRTISVLSSGTQTTLQDFPARQGYWHVGIPPSGPMDAIAHQQANYLVGNSSDKAALEITLNGPSLQFHCDSIIAITGATLDLQLDDQPLETYNTYPVKVGQTLTIGKITGAGARAYLGVKGGIDCPEYLGSRSTFTLGQFGGHSGRALLTGDTLHMGKPESHHRIPLLAPLTRPSINEQVTLRVIYGPHGAPDFFTVEDIERFFQHTWEVHYNSSRTGVRLIGPKPTWARETGGEAGLHPSNIHDNAYAIGAIDFTGDMPVILGPDGPSLGGFVCSATVITADLWKLGQLKAGTKITFTPVTIEQAVRLEAESIVAMAQGHFHEGDQPPTASANASVAHTSRTHTSITHTPITIDALPSPVLAQTDFRGEPLSFRACGDHFLLIELGPMELDIARRFKIHALMLWLEENKLEGMREMTPGIRSLQLHYNAQIISAVNLIQQVQKAVASLAGELPTKIPSRVVHIPLSWNDKACQEAIEKYTQSVRPGAPWCPSNLEFIRRINGLQDIADVKKIVFDARYLVMGLGDVYLGAPVATPIDPRHRLVTTKYNPARTWTAENSVGIGGAYLCIYGMEGPGGYQFVGRTLQMWNRHRQTKEFEQPWLLRFFDQIKFYEVSAEELVQIRKDFPLGRYPLKIEQTEFDLDAYIALMQDEAEPIKAFQSQRQQAFDAELQHWRETGQLTYESPEQQGDEAEEDGAPADCAIIDSPASGSLWKLCVNAGDAVQQGATLAILESMKMEIEITSPCDGTVHKVLKAQGQAITNGQSIFWLMPGK